MQLGKALGILAKAEADEILSHSQIEAFYAPGECHGAVSKGEARRRRQALRKAKAASGLSRRQFNLARKQVDPRVVDRCVGRILQRSAYYR